MQKPDYYINNNPTGLPNPDLAKTDAAKEFLKRLRNYGQCLSAVNVQMAVGKVVEGIIPTASPTRNRFGILMKEEEEKERERH